MQHGFDSNLNVLRRWGAMSERPLPSDWAAFRQANPSEAIAMESRDPQLVSLLNNTCSATLKADALSGKFSPVAPDVAATAEQNRQGQIQQLMDRNPWGSEKGDAPSLTAQMQLAQLDPQLYEREMAKHQVKADPTAADRAAIAHAAAEARVASMNAARQLLG